MVVLISFKGLNNIDNTPTLTEYKLYTTYSNGLKFKFVFIGNIGCLTALAKGECEENIKVIGGTMNV